MNTALQTLEQSLQARLGQSVIGMEAIIRALAVAIVARGHVLLQGPPGLGKTLLSKTLATALGGVFKRVQGTADLMPSDIVGVHVYDTSRNEFVFRPGPIFADVLLADEINRAGPKTQSALLEAMEERQISVDGKHYALPPDFLVIATQNPRDFEGTYPLPESQLDRFMLRIDLPYPSRAHEQQVLLQYGTMAVAAVPDAVAVVSRELLSAARAEVDAVHVAPELSGYVIDLASASREHAHVALGLSTRGSLALLRTARIHAALRGAEFAAPDDVKAMAPLVIPHRLVLAPEALLEGTSELAIAQRLLELVPVPK
ncbi:MAG: MoxR family ATPase [Steroidobacteraceae bacterium]